MKGWLFFVFLGFSTALCASHLYPFETEQQAAQFNRLLRTFRCLVCQNQDLADSTASLAMDLRADIYRAVRLRKTDDQITTALTSRYGDFILFMPRMNPLTWLLWGGPVLFLILGLVLLWRLGLKQQVRDE